MASLFPDFEYDIFISYRQKDNKYDGWVTEFVDNLKRELEATFKEELSVYFDNNPHDGLLETHDVNASLNKKLKCLVFLPILSKTYCDNRSYAWQNEFLTFIEQASGDRFGMKVALSNGNIANRVLPVRIHELESDDIRICESALGGVLRCIDFIYKSAGVNRPLRANEDHPHDNLNKIYYRDQINKLANAIDEILRSLKNSDAVTTEIYPVKQRKTSGEIIYPDPGEADRVDEVFDELHPKADSGRKEMSITLKIKTIRFNELKKYIYTLLILAPLIALVFSWKDIKRITGFGHSRRETAKVHVENATRNIYNNELDSASSELDKAISSDPEYSYAWSTMAALSVRQENLNKAILETLEALKFDPLNFQAAYNMAFALDDKQDYIQATEWYSKAIRIDSTFVPAYSALGHLYNLMNQPLDAIIVLRLAERKFPQSEFLYLVYKNLGISYYQMSIYDQAIRYLELSKSAKPELPETCLYLARSYEASGKMTKSIDLWQDYINLETDTIKNREAKRHLKEITIKHLKELIK
jgi:Tfp pilus assembly protein PilF